MSKWEVGLWCSYTVSPYTTGSSAATVASAGLSSVNRLNLCTTSSDHSLHAGCYENVMKPWSR